MTYTPEERRAYVRGAVSACLTAKADVEATAKVCSDLCIAPEELKELSDAERKPLCKEKLPFVPGILGGSK